MIFIENNHKDMKSIFKIATLVIILGMYNCTSTKGAESKDTLEAKTNVQNTLSKEMIDQGFKKGTITSNKTEKCPYILNIEEYKDNLDPINLDKFFKDTEIPSQVWVKFSSLRMPSRCNDARPVSITEINIRTN